MEEKPPPGVRHPLSWLLLCLEDLDGGCGAIRICQWHERRWGIEEFFRTLKTGSELHKHQFDQAEDLAKCMAFNAITAWRFDLQRMAKYEPDRRTSEVIETMEIQALRRLPHHMGKRHTIRPAPGTKKIWQGTEQLMGGLKMLDTLDKAF